jgi:hypothetical protein
MKSLTKFLGIIAIGAAVVIGLAGCDSGDDGGGGGGSGLSGNWSANVYGSPASVIISGNTWSLSVPGLGFSDQGTYNMSGATAILRSTVYNLETGTAVLIDSNTIGITLNGNSAAPGTYILYRG